MHSQGWASGEIVELFMRPCDGNLRGLMEVFLQGMYLWTHAHVQPFHAIVTNKLDRCGRRALLLSYDAIPNASSISIFAGQQGRT